MEVREKRRHLSKKKVRSSSRFSEEKQRAVRQERERERAKGKRKSKRKEKNNSRSLLSLLSHFPFARPSFLSLVRSGVSRHSKGHGALRLGASTFLLPAMRAVHTLVGSGRGTREGSEKSPLANFRRSSPHPATCLTFLLYENTRINKTTNSTRAATSTSWPRRRG